MTIANASWYSLPHEPSATATDFQTITELSCLVIVAHEPQEGHVDWCHSYVKCLKVQAKLSTKTVENLQQFGHSSMGLSMDQTEWNFMDAYYTTHLGSIYASLHFKRFWFG